MVKLKEVIDAEDEDKLFILMDFCEKGEIMEWDENINQFTPFEKDMQNFEESQIR